MSRLCIAAMGGGNDRDRTRRPGSEVGWMRLQGAIRKSYADDSKVQGGVWLLTEGAAVKRVGEL